MHCLVDHVKVTVDKQHQLRPHMLHDTHHYSCKASLTKSIISLLSVKHIILIINCTFAEEHKHIDRFIKVLSDWW